MRIISFLLFNLLISFHTKAQNIDSLQLYQNEIPDGYKLSDNNNCISIQATLFYKDPSIYSSIIGNLVSKRIQNFDNKKDSGSILYFEFDDNFKAELFLGSLLWGGNKPTREHPEEFFSKGKFLVIWSFKKGNVVTKKSKDKLIKILN
ncbi:MAG: hypothetical protein ACRCVT_05480 [Leadbetterella sp.]